MNVTIRPPRAAEAEAIADLFNEISNAAYGAADTTVDEIRLWFTSPGVHPESDVRVAVDTAGRLVGYGDVSDDGGIGTRILLDLRERAGSGVVGSLLDSLLPRAREYAARAADGTETTLRGYAPSAERSVAELYAARGFEVVRHSYRMAVDLDDEPLAPEWPAGIEVRTFHPKCEEREVYEVVNEAFADTWEYVANPFEEWRHFMIGAADFDPTLWFLAVEGSEIAGVCLCRPHDFGEPETGWVRVLAVRPAWRRRGIGQALLRHAFRAFRQRGLLRAGLGVDAESTTGALELYARAGMRVVREGALHDRRL